jgi:SAM-dependent methyltransferase
MNRATISALLELNRSFYQRHAADFSRTREAPWPGWTRLLEGLEPLGGEPLSVLDLGCGNGRLGVFLASAFEGMSSYTGIDASASLIAAARTKLEPLYSRRDLTLGVFDFVHEPLDTMLGDRRFSLVALMGVLHHVPGRSERTRILRALASRVAERGRLAVSVWRFGVKERFCDKIVPWQEHNERVAPEDRIDVRELEPGDHLLRWGKDAVRYCHFVDDDELAEIVSSTGIPVEDSFLDDGADRDFNRYLIFACR